MLRWRHVRFQVGRSDTLVCIFVVALLRGVVVELILRGPVDNERRAAISRSDRSFSGSSLLSKTLCLFNEEGNTWRVFVCARSYEVTQNPIWVSAVRKLVFIHCIMYCLRPHHHRLRFKELNRSNTAEASCPIDSDSVTGPSEWVFSVSQTALITAPILLIFDF